MKNNLTKIKSIITKEDIEYFGILPLYDAPLRYTPDNFPRNGSVIVILLPYLKENSYGGNISVYAAVEDYHIITQKKLEKICNKTDELFDKNNHKIYCDNSPFDEKKLAQKAGLGIIGKNNLLINEKYGSYVFIAEIVTNIIIEPYIQQHKMTPCKGSCCIDACPTGALSENGYNKEKCLSYISQKTGELTQKEKNLLIKNNTIWGCDICQKVCPKNKNIKLLQNKIFSNEIINNLSYDELSAMSEQEFNEKYKNRAWSWRGKSVILRNLHLLMDGITEPNQ